MEGLGPWIFATAVFLVLSYLLIFRPRARRVIGIALLVIGVLCGGLVAYLIIQQQYSDAEYARKSALAKSAIQPSDLVFSDLRINVWGNLSTRYGDVTGTIKNNSKYTLDDAGLTVRIWNCPVVGGANCAVVGEATSSAYGMKVPPGQARSLSMSFSFDNLPELKDGQWTWTYRVVSVEAAL